MNHNSIIGLAMLYALWQNGRKDLLELIKPFVIYSVAMTTKVGEEIDINKICEQLINEFGFRSFPMAVVNNVLRREAQTKHGTTAGIVQRRNKKYILIQDLQNEIDAFSSKRTSCKAQSDAVTKAMYGYFNEKRVCGRDNYQQEDAERFLLLFFERKGGTTLQSVENLVQLTYKNNEVEYYVAQFILEQYQGRTVLMDYIIELIKGYFVTVAIYLQADNANVTTSSFKDVIFFLDTRIILACLGLKSKQENESAKEMIRTLLNNGAQLACLPYNVDEVDGILEAYKNSRINYNRWPAPYTLEYFDEQPNGYSLVDSYQRNINKILERNGVKCISYDDAVPESQKEYSTKYGIDYNVFQTIVLSLKSNYNLLTLSDDIHAIETIIRIRDDKRLPYIERCKAVFVTNNIVLIRAMLEYFKKDSKNIGVPFAISCDELCVIAWLKSFERDSELPKMRLLENVLAAVTPSRDLINAYFLQLQNLERQGEISKEEVTLLRVDQYAKRELMDLTHGDLSNLTDDVIEKIRTQLRLDGYNAGESSMRSYYEARIAGEEAERKMMEQKRHNEQKNKACLKAEREVNEEYKKIEEMGLKCIKCISVVIAAVFILASVVLIDISEGFFSLKNCASVIVTCVAVSQAVPPFFSHDNFLTKKYVQWIRKQRIVKTDERKQKFLSIIDSPVEEESVVV